MKHFMDVLEKILRIILGVLFAVMVLVVFYQVVLRYGFHKANAWADELSRYCMIWVVMFTAPVGFRRYRHIRVDALVKKFPPKVQRIVNAFMYALMAAFLVAMIFAGSSIARTVVGQKSGGGLNLPVPFLYTSSITVGSALTLLFLVETIYNEYFKRGKEADEA